jgi:adenosine deaminase
MDSSELLVNLPKIDLHRHLEGSLRFSTLMELVRDEGMDLPTDEESLRKIVQIYPGDPMSFSNFLSKFKPLREFYRSPEIIQRFVCEAIIDAALDNVRYLELGFTPFALAQFRDFPLQEVVDWVVEAAQETANQEGMGVGLILSVNRHESIQLAERVAQIAADYLGKGIVGLGLSGNEVDFSTEPFLEIFHVAQEAGLKTTVHAGEWTGAETVRYALERMGADRIGHGVRIMEDPEVVSLAREQRTVFEVCLSSNFQSGVVEKIGTHPLPAMIQAGLQVTLNTDDPGISNIRLSDEFQIAIDELGLSKTTLCALTLVAAQAAFLDREEKKTLESRLEEELFHLRVID